MNVLCDTCRTRLEFSADTLIGASRERCACDAGKWRPLRVVVLPPLPAATERNGTRRAQALVRYTVEIPCSICGCGVPVHLRTLDPDTIAKLRRYCSAPCRLVGKRAHAKAQEARRSSRRSHEKVRAWVLG